MKRSTVTLIAMAFSFVVGAGSARLASAVANMGSPDPQAQLLNAEPPPPPPPPQRCSRQSRCAH